MAKSIKIELDDAGIQEYLKSAGVVAELESLAGSIASAADAALGDKGYTVVTGTRGQNRAHVFVQTDTLEAMRAEGSGGHLLRAVNAGRRA